MLDKHMGNGHHMDFLISHFEYGWRVNIKTPKDTRYESLLTHLKMIQQMYGYLRQGYWWRGGNFSHLPPFIFTAVDVVSSWAVCWIVCFQNCMDSRLWSRMALLYWFRCSIPWQTYQTSLGIHSKRMASGKICFVRNQIRKVSIQSALTIYISC